MSALLVSGAGEGCGATPVSGAGEGCGATPVSGAGEGCGATPVAGAAWQAPLFAARSKLLVGGSRGGCRMSALLVSCPDEEALA